MNRNKRPLSVSILGWVYIAVGTAGFIYHFTDLRVSDAFLHDGLWIQLIEVLAILCGAFMLQGHNWARCLAVAWMAFHVVLSAFDAFRGFVVHCLLCALIVWLLFRPAAAQYFRRAQNP